MFYYVRVFLNVYHISHWWFECAQVLFMIWNALNDPVFGYLQDVGGCGYSWMRNRRLSILYFGPLLAVSFMLPWIPFSDSVAQPWIVGAHLILALFFYDGFFSFAMLAWCALCAESTTSHSERVRIVKYNQVAVLLAVNVIVIVEKTSDSLQDFRSFRVLNVLLMCLAMMCFVYTGLYSPDTVAQLHSFGSATILHDDKLVKSTTADSTKWASSVRYTIQVLRSPNFHFITWTNFFHTIRSTSHANFAAIFTEGLIPRSWLPLGSWQISLFYWVCSVVPQLCVIVNVRFVERYGPCQVFKRSLLLTVVLGLCTWMYGRHQPIIIMLFMLVDSVLVHALSPMFMILFPDLIDDDMVRHQRTSPLSSLIFSLNALIVKPAQSIAPMLVVSVLNWNGDYEKYKLQKGGTVTEHDYQSLRDSMFGLLCGLPVILAVLQYLVLSRYTLHDKHTRNTVKATESDTVESSLQLL